MPQYEQLRNGWKEGSTFVVEIEGHCARGPAQRLLIMGDGTALRVQDPHQLDGLREGVKLRIPYENRDGRTVILRADRVANGL